MFVFQVLSQLDDMQFVFNLAASAHGGAKSRDKERERPKVGVLIFFGFKTCSFRVEIRSELARGGGSKDRERKDTCTVGSWSSIFKSSTWSRIDTLASFHCDCPWNSWPVLTLDDVTVLDTREV